MSQSQFGSWMSLRFSLEAGRVSESVWKLDESQSQFGGWVGLRVSLEAVCVS